jgi:hypothetical protein
MSFRRSPRRPGTIVMLVNPHRPEEDDGRTALRRPNAVERP